MNRKYVDGKDHGLILSATPFIRGNEETYAITQYDLRFDTGNSRMRSSTANL
jgi:hypothetical protein